MIGNVVVRSALPAAGALPSRHVLVLVPHDAAIAEVPEADVLRTVLARRNLGWGGNSNAVITGDVSGALVAWQALDRSHSTFGLQQAIRKALEPLFLERPAHLALVIAGTPRDRERFARLAVFTALANSRYRPGGGRERLELLAIHGVSPDLDFASERAVAHGNMIARELTVAAPNRLTPGALRERVRELARTQGWSVEEHSLEDLRRLGCGAFCCVARASPRGDAAIVRIRYRPRRGTSGRVAIAGKGICMDTGGYGMKSARAMHGMHEDMNGAAVALGILHAATALDLPLAIDGWLAIADNLLSPEAYLPGEVVTAFDRTTIEVVHPDAEGRMVLADTLAMAARDAPMALLDFATLTNAMVSALGTRMSGVFSNRPELERAAVECGRTCGERVVAFPLEADYDEALVSAVADIRQCTDLGDADHILAARFLQRFVSGTPWVHMDLSAYRNEAGLGAVSENVTGFGVAWGVEMLGRIARGEDGLAARAARRDLEIVG